MDIGLNSSVDLEFFKTNFVGKYYVKPGTEVSNLLTDLEKKKV
jgi:hypothetical protein